MFEPRPANDRRPVVCVGEVLWDAVPEGLRLGGAPYNVSYHLGRLGQPVRLVSRVGDDVLGHEARRRLAAGGGGDALVQTDGARPTGFVEVALDADGVPSYTIARPAAWDAIAPSAEAVAAAGASAAVVFGSLAQRDERSRRTIRALVAAAPLAVFDVNLRPPFVDREAVEASLGAAALVKLSDDELGQLGAWFGLPAPAQEAAEALCRRFGCRAVCVTRGAEGAALGHAGRWTEHAGYSVRVRDTVGAGDAFLAGLLSAWLDGQDDASALDQGCRLGAFVASRAGATPSYGVRDVDRAVPSGRPEARE